MSSNPQQLLQTLLSIMEAGTAPAYMLNKSFDVYTFAQNLFKDIEDKRSSITALTRTQAAQLSQNNLQFSAVKHESRLNCFYRLLGLPTEINLDNSFSFLDASGNKITNKANLTKKLLQREYEQLSLTFKQFLSANTLADLNTQLNSLQQQEKELIAELFDPNVINTNRLFPIVQFNQIQNVVGDSNRIAPPFASTEERYVNSSLMSPPFLESVITIRLLQQSGGSKINTQGAVEDIILQALGFALAELAKQYHRNQSEAENALKDGIALIRNKVVGVNSPAVKAADINANTRENDGITTANDVRSKYTQQQIQLYEAAISLLPTENDVIPTDIQINDVPFQNRNIKANALTNSFISIINANNDALQRSIQDNKKTLQKRQLTQDKLTAELGSSIGKIGGISLAEIIIVISALFVMEEQDLVGLISKTRFDQLIGATNNNTTTSSSTNDSGQQTTAQKQINIFDILKQFKDTRTSTTNAVQKLQDIVSSIYISFKNQLATAHIID